MHKTTLYLDDALYARLQREAEERGTTQALVVREAIAAYVAKRRKKPRSVGMGRSGKGDLSTRADAYLEGFGTRR
jgi:predicted transcriptional regulator